MRKLVEFLSKYFTFQDKLFRKFWFIFWPSLFQLINSKLCAFSWDTCKTFPDKRFEKKLTILWRHDVKIRQRMEETFLNKKRDQFLTTHIISFSISVTWHFPLKVSVRVEFWRNDKCLRTKWMIVKRGNSRDRNVTSNTIEWTLLMAKKNKVAPLKKVKTKQ